MSSLRFVIAALVSVLLVAFQAAPGPYVLCASVCPIAGGSGETVEVICWSGPIKTGCCVVEAGSDCGSCDTALEIVLEDVGCCVADAVCPPIEDCPAQSCPMDDGNCYYCLPGRVLAELAPRAIDDLEQPDIVAQALASEMLHQSDQVFQIAHSHSPPPTILAASGHDLCIANCLLLI